MAEKEIALLKEQVQRLDDKKFDIEAWKSQTIIYLERIFGKDSSKLKLIRELHYDYSSWSLRDTTGAGEAKDPVRLKARSILEAAVEELEKLGLPGNPSEPGILASFLGDELTGKQMKEIEGIISSDAPDKQQKIAKILETLEKESLSAVLSKILLS